METLQIPLTDNLKKFLEAQASRKGFPTPGDYVQSLLNDLVKRDAERKELEAKLLEGVRSPKVAGDAAFWKKLKQKIYDKHPELESNESPLTTVH